MSYDSRADNLIHSQRVGELMAQVMHELLDRSMRHDRSKTQQPEVEVFDEFTPKLRDSTYGSDEYRGFLAEMKPALDHHYAENRHHPEHFPRGVNDMTLADLVEMLADWKAAGERHTDGSMRRSLEVQKDRFGLGDQLLGILENTARHFGWFDDERPAGMPRANCQGLDGQDGGHKPHEFMDVGSGLLLWCDGSDHRVLRPA